MTTTVIVISLKLTKNIQTVIAVAGVSLEITYSIILDQNNELGKIELKKAITKVNSKTWQVAMNKFTSFLNMFTRIERYETNVKMRQLNSTSFL